MTATLVSAWTAARKRLEAVGVESPAVDARLLLEAAAGVARIDILTDPHRELTPEQAERLEAFLVRREAREPVSQIVGRRAFWTLNLRVTPDVLTPRPETERLLDIALALLPADRAFTALDLGLGSGAILLALLAERPLARGVGVEISDAALQIARENAAELGLAGRADLRLGDWTEGLADSVFDLVLANPPYIPTAEIAALEPEMPVSSVLTLDRVVGESLGNAGFSATLVLAFAILSLLLACVGLYGVLSYLMTQRSTEIGIRIALGARREQVLRLMLVDGLRPALFGLAAGIAASVAAAQLIRHYADSMLYRTRALDPEIFAIVAATLLAVAALACVVPAWRASRLDPMQALRTE